MVLQDEHRAHEVAAPAHEGKGDPDAVAIESSDDNASDTDEPVKETPDVPAAAVPTIVPRTSSGDSGEASGSDSPGLLRGLW